MARVFVCFYLLSLIACLFLQLVADQEAMLQEKRTVMTLPSDPIRISSKKADREAQKAFEKAKLGTDMSYLDREVLSWNFASIQADKPPFNVQDLKKVPLTFPKGMAQYREVFQPLLFLECWEHLVTAKEEMGDLREISVGMTLEAVASVDTFLEITFMAPTKEVRLISLTENELINCVVVGEGGKQTAFLGKTLTLQTRKDEMRATVRAYGPQLLPHLRMQSKWTIIKLMSLATVHREFAAMQAIDYFPLKDLIYRPRTTERPRLDEAKVKEIRTAYGVNKPQLVSSFRKLGFWLLITLVDFQG